MKKEIRIYTFGVLFLLLIIILFIYALKHI